MVSKIVWKYPFVSIGDFSKDMSVKHENATKKTVPIFEKIVVVRLL